MSFIKDRLGISELENRIKSLESRIEHHENVLKEMSENMKAQAISMVYLTDALKKIVFSLTNVKKSSNRNQETDEKDYN